jgi:DNA-binding HxlR family transcriptional regulator
MNSTKIIHEPQKCSRAKLAIQDTLDIIGGKWKLVLIVSLQNGPLGFNELCRMVGISPRILSKDLQEMEMNGLVNRSILSTKPISVKYSLTEYASTLFPVLESMEQWGQQHRSRIMNNQISLTKKLD